MDQVVKASESLMLSFQSLRLIHKILEVSICLLFSKTILYRIIVSLHDIELVRVDLVWLTIC